LRCGEKKAILHKPGVVVLRQETRRSLARVVSCDAEAQTKRRQKKRKKKKKQERTATKKGGEESKLEDIEIKCAESRISTIETREEKQDKPAWKRSAKERRVRTKRAEQTLSLPQKSATCCS